MATRTTSKPTSTRTRKKLTPQTTSTESVVRVPNTPCYELPAVRGIQAGREYYTSMIPLRLLKKLFVFEHEAMPAEMRAQRELNPRRAKAIAHYVLNTQPYFLSALTVTIDVPQDAIADFYFEPIREGSYDTGHLQIPMTSQFLIADGQHRTAGLHQALQENPQLADETIPVVLFLHTSLQAAQQIFHDLNHFTAKPTKSLNLLYDHRTDGANLTREVWRGVPVFRQFTDTERTSLMQKSSKLFTLNGLAEANEALLFNFQQPFEEQVRLAIAYWQAVTEVMPDWTAIQQKRRYPGEVRQELLSGHAITLVALGYLGNFLLRYRPDDWQQELQAIDLAGVDWSKTNPDWQNLILFGGCIRKNKTTAFSMARFLDNRTKMSQEYLENHFDSWLKIRHHEDSIATLVQDSQWEEETKKEVIATVSVRFDADAAERAWNIVACNYRMIIRKQQQVAAALEQLSDPES